MLAAACTHGLQGHTLTVLQELLKSTETLLLVTGMRSLFCLNDGSAQAQKQCSQANLWTANVWCACDGPEGL